MRTFKSTWLFRFTSYYYCQGTRDRFAGDLRLIQLTLPCDEWEAKSYLKETLIGEGLEFDENSIESLNINITNS